EIAEGNAEFVDCDDTDRIATVITSLMNNADKLKILSVGALKQSKKYNAEIFKKRLREVVYL
ncbi:MAG: hypothetical protein V1922_03500, partial [bacterium]